jgi:succinate dehydrogenase / fumarate reductase cytochrome b subunit
MHPAPKNRANVAFASVDFTAKVFKSYAKGTKRSHHMADVNRGNRPLSPHLSIYRPQLTSMTSILTRITGNALMVSSLLIIWWFLAAATSPEAFARADGFLTSWFGDLVMTLSLWGLWYHTLAGVRHLIWDNAIGLDLETAYKLGYAVIGGSIILTLLTIVIV